MGDYPARLPAPPGLGGAVRAGGDPRQQAFSLRSWPAPTCCATSGPGRGRPGRLARAGPGGTLDGVPALAGGAQGRARPPRWPRRGGHRTARARVGPGHPSGRPLLGRHGRPRSRPAQRRPRRPPRRHRLAHRGPDTLQPDQRPLPVGQRPRPRRRDRRRHRPGRRARGLPPGRRPATWAAPATCANWSFAPSHRAHRRHVGPGTARMLNPARQPRPDPSHATGRGTRRPQGGRSPRCRASAGSGCQGFAARLPWADDRRHPTVG